MGSLEAFRDAAFFLRFFEQKSRYVVREKFDPFLAQARREKNEKTQFKKSQFPKFYRNRDIAHIGRCEKF
jgi:hypothetical protein